MASLASQGVVPYRSSLPTAPRSRRARRLDGCPGTIEVVKGGGPPPMDGYGRVGLTAESTETPLQPPVPGLARRRRRDRRPPGVGSGGLGGAAFHSRQRAARPRAAL